MKKHRFLSLTLAFVLALALCMTLALIPAFPLTAHAAGTPDTSWYNTTDSAFNISTADQLAGLAELVNGDNDFSGKTITLTSDLDLSAYQSGTGWMPIGRTTNPSSTNVYSFNGIFDGNDKTITGLYINDNGDDTYSDNKGLFGALSGGTVKDLTLSNVNITGRNYVGGVAGQVRDGGTISNCAVTCAVPDKVTGYDYVGGVAGHVRESTLSNCRFDGTVTGTANAARVGGVAGVIFMDGAAITNCHSTGTVTATGISASAGGVVGSVSSNTVVEGCSSASAVNGGYSAGGIAGENTGEVNNCAALNPSVSGTNAGRVVGGDNYHHTGNVAWDGMEVNGSTVTSPDPAYDGESKTTDECIAFIRAIGGDNAALPSHIVTAHSLNCELDVCELCGRFAPSPQPDTPIVNDSYIPPDMTPFHGVTDPKPEQTDLPSDWAAAAVKKALELKLVPARLQGDWTANLTRADFCALAVKLYEYLDGKPITARAYFDDTNDINVQKLAGLGIVAGGGGGGFDPNGAFTREMALTLMYNMMVQLGNKFDDAEPSFADADKISPWAKAAIGALQKAGVVSGDGQYFNPTLIFTREMGIVTVINFLEHHST